MNKKALKNLLALLGVGLLIGALVVALKTGTHVVGHYEIMKGFVPTGHKFFFDEVEFQYAVPLLIGALLCFIISGCLKGDTDTKLEESKEAQKDETTSDKLEKLKELYEKQLISEDEYNSKKTEILSKEL